MKRKHNRAGILWLLLAVAVIVGSLAGVALGKYIKTSQYSGTLQIEAKLADTMTLLEHEAIRQADGSYELDLTADPVTQNTYELIPGLDIPKDPYITITNKTPIDAYLFAEVVDETGNAAIGWAMNSNWLLLEGVTGKHGGAVYVYTAGSGAPAIVDEAVGATFTVGLLESNTITVSQKLNASATADTLTFYACMGEVAASDAATDLAKAKDIYQNHITA